MPDLLEQRFRRPFLERRHELLRGRAVQKRGTVPLKSADNKRTSLDEVGTYIDDASSQAGAEVACAVELDVACCQLDGGKVGN